MKKSWLFAIVPGVMLIFVVALFLVKLLWAWTVPDLFPGAVQQGLVAGSITWLTALKLAVFLAVLSALPGGRGGKGS